MVQVVLDEDIVLGMQLGLLAARGRIGRTIGKLHNALVADANSLAPIVARITGFRRDARIFDIAHLDLRLAGALHAVDQQLSWLLL